jgi:hypothetical protein
MRSVAVLIAFLGLTLAAQAQDVEEFRATFPEIGLDLIERTRSGSTYLFAGTANAAGIAENAQITKINGLGMRTFADAEVALVPSRAGQTIAIEYYDASARVRRTVQVPVVSDARTDAPATPARPLNMPASSHRKREHDRRAAALAGGYIYKGDQYWSQIPGYTLRYAFEGQHEKYIIPFFNIDVALRTYAELVSLRCRDRLGPSPETVRLDQIITETDDLGVSRTSRETLLDIQVSQRVAPALRKVLGKLNDQTRITPNLRGLRHGAQMVRFMRGTVGEVERIFEIEDCDSPVLDQLEENLVRMELNEPTIQRNPDTAFKNAAALSEPVLEPGGATTLAAACLASKSPEEMIKYYAHCACVGNRVTPTLTPEQLEMGLVNYYRLRDYIEWGRIPALANAQTAYAACHQL